jgi:hypothetical protein
MHLNTYLFVDDIVHLDLREIYYIERLCPAVVIKFKPVEVSTTRGTTALVY